MGYNKRMSDEQSSAIEQVNDEVRLQRALAVVEHQVRHGSTIRAACEACEVSERTFYAWVHAGALTSYLTECQQSRATAASTMAAGAIPDVMKYMIEIATGEKAVRGANPVAAAQFIFVMAGASGPQTSAAEEKPSTNIMAFVPEMLTINVVAPGRHADIIEGVVVEVSDPDE